MFRSTASLSILIALLGGSIFSTTGFTEDGILNQNPIFEMDSNTYPQIT